MIKIINKWVGNGESQMSVPNNTNYSVKSGVFKCQNICSKPAKTLLNTSMGCSGDIKPCSNLDLTSCGVLFDSEITPSNGSK